MHGLEMMDRFQATGNNRVRKRKAEATDNNERLSKRLSLLNLERNGEKLYVPVEYPTSTTISTPSKPKAPLRTNAPQDEDAMQLDDTKHKVYIYDLDAELSDSESDDGKLVFLPDIQKHLRDTRIPPMVFANNEGELAGLNNQLVLYNIPSSLTVPEEQDSVRKAIIESRARMRARQEGMLNGGTTHAQTDVKKDMGATEWYRGTGGIGNTANMSNVTAPGSGTMEAEPTIPISNGPLYDDPDAMDLG